MTPDTGRMGCIVLAAGGSTRFGAPKQLALHAGEPLVHRAARAALESGAVTVIVTGAFSKEVENAVGDLAPLIVEHNDQWRVGLSSSIAVGIRALERAGPFAGVLITLADQPHVDSSCLGRLISRFDEHHRVIAAEYNQTIGVPVLVGAELVDGLLHLSGDRGGKAWLLGLGSITRVAMPEAAVDIDTIEDLARISRERHDAGARLLDDQ